MIRIVAIEHAAQPEGEFILFQNQGSMREILRGHCVMSERCLNGETGTSYAFPEDEPIPSGAFIMLRTGYGQPRWGRTRDGAQIYVTFMGQDQHAWDETAGVIHILKVQHTYREIKSCVSVGAVG